MAPNDSEWPVHREMSLEVNNRDVCNCGQALMTVGLDLFSV